MPSGLSDLTVRPRHCRQDRPTIRKEIFHEELVEAEADKLLGLTDLVLRHPANSHTA